MPNRCGTADVVVREGQDIKPRRFCSRENAAEDQSILQALEATPGIVRVIDLKTLHLGPSNYWWPSSSVSAQKPRRRGRPSHRGGRAGDPHPDPIAISIYLEPDNYRADYHLPGQ